MVKKRSEQEWRELIDNFESHGHQNPTMFCVAHNVHAHELKQKQMERKTNRFFPVMVTDDQPLLVYFCYCQKELYVCTITSRS